MQKGCAFQAHPFFYSSLVAGQALLYGDLILAQKCHKLHQGVQALFLAFLLSLCYFCLMFRPFRIEYPGTVFKVTSRGNKKKPVFKDCRDSQNFVSILQHYIIGFLLPLFPVETLAADAVAPQGNIPDAYSSILQRGVLGGESDSSSAPQAAPVFSPYRLIGTLQSGGFSGAVLDDGTGVQTFYRIDQRLPDDSRIVKVLRDRVLIRRPDGTFSELVAADDGKAPALSAAPGAGPSAAPPSDAVAPNSVQPATPKQHRRRSSRTDE
jgi:hypothetical protein